VSHGLKIQEIENAGPRHTFNIPNSVIEMFMGALGEPAGGWPKKMSAAVLKGAKPRRGRPGAHLAPVDLDETAVALEAKIGRAPSRIDVMSYLMYPEVYLKFARNQNAWGDVDVLPTPQFFYGMTKDEETTVEIEPGKVLIVKFLTASDPHPDGTRTVFFELNGQPREVTVRDRSLGVRREERPKADPARPGHVGAPIPGAVTSIVVEPGAQVAKGDRLLVMEAMKMQTTVTAPLDGRVIKLLVKTGESVEPKDLLVVIE
jgi:pyruvate carboxylase